VTTRHEKKEIRPLTSSQWPFLRIETGFHQKAKLGAEFRNEHKLKHVRAAHEGITRLVKFSGSEVCSERAGSHSTAGSELYVL